MKNYIYDEASISVRRMFKTVDPIAFACYSSTFEFYNITLTYFDTLKDSGKLFYNTIHNLGKIYDNTVSLIELYKTIDVTVLD